MCINDVNDSEIFDAEPRLSFSEKKSPSRNKTLSKRVLPELRFLQNITEPKWSSFEVTF